METEKLLIDKNKVYQLACVGCTRHGEELGECNYDEPCERLIFAFTVAEPVDAVEMPDTEMLKAIKMLIKQYERSKRSDYVHNPIAHAFFHTWKQLDESGYGERKKE